MDLNRRRFLTALVASAATAGVLGRITGWPHETPSVDGLRAFRAALLAEAETQSYFVAFVHPHTMANLMSIRARERWKYAHRRHRLERRGVGEFEVAGEIDKFSGALIMEG